MLLARRSEFMLWVLMPRTEPSADGFLPFQGVVVEWRLGICVAWVVNALEIDCTMSGRIVGPTGREILISNFINHPTTSQSRLKN